MTARPFELSEEVELHATLEQAWEAIATGPGLDSWFLGTNDIEAGKGGRVRTTFTGWSLESRVTAWDPPTRFTYETEGSQDGRLMSFDYLLEPRGDTTGLRFVHSGTLPGDVWEEEYDALKEGNPMLIHALSQYLRYFPGRVGTAIGASGPKVEPTAARRVYMEALGLSGAVNVGDRVRSAPHGLPPIEGVVDYVSRDTIGVRTDDALYRFLRGLGGAVSLDHHLFFEVDRLATDRTWQAWLYERFPGEPSGLQEPA